MFFSIFVIGFLTFWSVGKRQKKENSQKEMYHHLSGKFLTFYFLQEITIYFSYLD